MPAGVAAFLRRKGHEGWTAYDANLQEASDDDLNVYAKSEGAIFVTINADCAATARRLQSAATVYLRVRERDAIEAMERAVAWLQANRLRTGQVLRVPKFAPIEVMSPLPW